MPEAHEQRFSKMFLMMSLPPEIRSTVFEHALSPTRASDIRTIGCLDLLTVSKLIYNEASLLPFQSNTIALPSITDSSTSPTLRVLLRLSPKQLNAVRRLDLQVVASTLDIAAAAKALRLLRLGNHEWDLDSANKSLPPSRGDLRELTVTLSSRDIAVPLSDCRAGLQQALDVEISPLFRWVVAFDTLRKLHVRVRVLHDDQFPKGMREALQATLSTLLPTVQFRFDFEAVQTPDCLINELDIYYPDSYMYMGMFGNICTVPQDFRHVYNSIEWAFG